MSATEPLTDPAAAVGLTASDPVLPSHAIPPIPPPPPLPSSSTEADVLDLLPSPPPPPPPQPPRSLSPPPTVQLYRPAEHAHLVIYLAALHGLCITHDGLSGTFAPPLHHEKLLAWWKVRVAEHCVVLWLRPPLLGTPTGAKPTGSDLVGAAMLRRHASETSPHVGVVELLLVSPRYRHRDVEGARALLAAVEAQALVDGRTLLTTETDADSPLAAIFAQLGFLEAGRIPGFVLRASGEKHDQVILYKDLAAPL